MMKNKLLLSSAVVCFLIAGSTQAMEDDQNETATPSLRTIPNEVLINAAERYGFVKELSRINKYFYRFVRKVRARQLSRFILTGSIKGQNGLYRVTKKYYPTTVGNDHIVEKLLNGEAFLREYRSDRRRKAVEITDEKGNKMLVWGANHYTYYVGVVDKQTGTPLFWDDTTGERSFLDLEVTRPQ